MKTTKVLMEIRSRAKQLQQIRFYLFLAVNDQQCVKRLVNKHECLVKELQTLKLDMLTTVVAEKFKHKTPSSMVI